MAAQDAELKQADYDTPSAITDTDRIMDPPDGELRQVKKELRQSSFDLDRVRAALASQHAKTESERDLRRLYSFAFWIALFALGFVVLKSFLF